MFIKVLEYVFIAVALCFIVMQIIIPARQGLTLFPLFRKTGKLESDLVAANQEVYDAKLSKEVEETHKKAAEVAVEVATQTKPEDKA